MNTSKAERDAQLKITSHLFAGLQLTQSVNAALKPSANRGAIQHNSLRGYHESCFRPGGKSGNFEIHL